MGEGSPLWEILNMTIFLFRSGYGLTTSQAVVECDLCDGNENIEWKCLTCNATLCEACQKRHSEKKTFKDHEVKKRADVDYGSECQIHNWKYTVMFCKDCHKAVCTKCISQIHQGHSLID